MDEVFDAIRLAFETPNGGSREARMIAYLVRLKALLPDLNPYFYDVDPELIRAHFPDERIPAGPPRDTCVIEEPPFVCESPWACALDGAAVDRPLLLKSPSNAYRLDFLRALFPNAEITVLHLIRDPVASVTGLMSGWLHHGFHKHRLPGRCARHRRLHAARANRGVVEIRSAAALGSICPHRPLEEVWRVFSGPAPTSTFCAGSSAPASDIQYVQTSTQRLTADLDRPKWPG